MNFLEQYFIPVLYILGNIGNLLSALIFSKKSWRKNVCVFYFNMCLLFNFGYINSAVLSAVLTRFNITPHNSNNTLCKLFFYVVFLFSTLTPTVLILASIDRLLISSQNVNTRLYSSKRLAYFSVSLSTIFWFIFYFHILVRVHIQEIFPSYFVCYYDLSASYHYFVSYSSLIINSTLCLSMIILCMIALKQVQRIRSIPRQQRQQQIRIMTKKDIQLLQCLFVQDIVYIIFSISLSISTAYQAVTISQVRTPSEQAIFDICNRFCIFLHHIPYCPSFYIFICVSRAFRNELKRMIYKLFGKDLTSIREEENIRKLNVAVVNLVEPLD